MLSCEWLLYVQIRRAYRNLATREHPDKGGSAEKFKAIQLAYDVLSKPAKVMGGGGSVALSSARLAFEPYRPDALSYLSPPSPSYMLPCLCAQHPSLLADVLFRSDELSYTVDADVKALMSLLLLLPALLLNNGTSSNLRY